MLSHFRWMTAVLCAALSCELWAQDVVIHIVPPPPPQSAALAKYIKEGDPAQMDVTVYVGQTVRWINDAIPTHTASSKLKDDAGNRIFHTGNITGGQHKDIVFDQAKYQAAHGVAGGQLELPYICTVHSAEGAMNSKIILVDAPPPPMPTPPLGPTAMAPALAHAAPAAAGAAALRVRKEVSQLTQAEISSVRQGVAVMKSRPANDRRSWRYWANMHWTTDNIADPLFNQCVHREDHFFTWHRAYLYFFEQVLRDASGDPNLTIPYWDWTLHPALPAIYRQPANPNTNPLYEQLRRLNNPALQLGPGIVVDALENAFSQSAFIDFSNSLDESPHGTIHTATGGTPLSVGFTGTMSRIETSANDPIFWAHHGNVDRIWAKWNAAGNANPSNPAFLNKTFTFVDVNGQNVSITAGAVLTTQALGYTYSDPQAAPAMPPSNLLASSAAPVGPPGFAAAPAADGAPAQRRALGLAPVRVGLALRQADTAVVRNSVAAMAAAPAADLPTNRVLIRVTGIDYNALPSCSYAVYVNLPEGPIDRQVLARHYVGTLDFFAKLAKGNAGHGAAEPAADGKSQTWDATRTLSRLQAAGIDVGDRVDVTIRPIQLELAPGADAQAFQQEEQAAAQNANLTFKAVELRHEP